MADFDVEYDLVVVGSGASGKSAALIAARAGKNVVILEKMPETGGLSVYAEGTCAFESSIQKELGTPRLDKYHFPTKAEGIEKFMHYSHQRANYDVVRAFVENSAETIDIYRDLGVVYKTCDIAAEDDPNEVWTFHLPEGLGAHCQEVLLDAVQKLDVDIFVNTPARELITEGRRFASESVAENIGDLGTYFGKQPDGIVWSILSQADVDRLSKEGSEIAIGEFVVYHEPMERLNTELEANIESGLVKKADTFIDLAKQMDVPTTTFVETMENYNKYCEQGYDDEFMKKPKHLRPLQEGPFYAIPLATGTMGSAGGIKVNGNMQVVDVDYNPIPGLYAVGLEVTGLYGDSYNMEVPGAANGFAHTSGRIAARHAIATYID